MKENSVSELLLSDDVESSEQHDNPITVSLQDVSPVTLSKEPDDEMSDDIVTDTKQLPMNRQQANFQRQTQPMQPYQRNNQLPMNRQQANFQRQTQPMQPYQRSNQPPMNGRQGNIPRQAQPTQPYQRNNQPPMNRQQANIPRQAQQMQPYQRSNQPPMNGRQGNIPRQAQQMQPYQRSNQQQMVPYPPSFPAPWSDRVSTENRPGLFQNKAKVKAIAALILGLLAIGINYFDLSLLGIVMSIVGIVLGQQSRKVIPKEHEDSVIATWGFFSSLFGLIISIVVPIVRTIFFIGGLLSSILRFLKILERFMNTISGAWDFLKGIFGF